MSLVDFSKSTQALHWTFDADSLARRRHTTREAALAKLKVRASREACTHAFVALACLRISPHDG